MLTSLRRAVTVIAASAITIGAGAGAALAFPSGGNPGATGPNHIEWTGQGSVTPNGQGGGCDASQEPNGQPANTPYIYWVLTTDGGSVNTNPSDTADQPLPYIVLTDHGNVQPQVPFDSSSSSNSVKFITPFFNLSTLQASAYFNATATGNGSWNLVISHGCAAPTAAAPPTVTKNAAGAYQTTFTWGIKKTVDQNQINAPPGADAKFTYTVTVTHDQGTNNHIVVSGNITVTNPNSAAINVGNVVDQLSNNVQCSLAQPTQLNPGDTKIPYVCSLPDGANLGGLTNTVTVSWADQTLSNGSHLAAGQANFTTPPIQFTQGTVTNNCVSVDDSVAGHLGQVCSTDPSPTAFTYTENYNQDPAGTCTTHDNTATITSTDTNGGQLGSDHQSVQVCVGQDLTVSKTAHPAFQRAYTWTLGKAVLNGPKIKTAGSATADYQLTVSHDQGTDSGWVVKGTVTVSNPNDWEAVKLASSQGLTDAIQGDSGASCAFDNGDPSGTTIPQADSNGPGTATFAYTCIYGGPPASQQETNVATASWDNGAAFTTDSSASGSAPVDWVNTSPTIVDGSVHVTDTLGGDLGNVSYNDPRGNPTLIDYSVNFPNDPAGTCTTHYNTATATASDSGATSTGKASVQVCVGADLTVTKNATPSFNRTYTWGITKTVDQPMIEIPQGGSAKPTYTVQVSQTGHTDSGFAVSGTITVTNPNDWESVTTTVGDTIDNGGTCTVNAGGTVSIPASSSATVPYTCTFPSNPGGGVNQAFALWDPSLAFTPDSTAVGSAPYGFGDPTTITDGSVDVTDTLGGHLGTVTYQDPSPQTFTYTQDYSGDPAGTCTTHDNTATFTTSDSHTTGSASQSVQVCIGEDLQVSKTATPAFNRTYNWNIAKQADKTRITGGTVNYSVKVTQTGVTDSGWTVKGKITVSNPNDWEPITLASSSGLVDAIDNGGSCSIDGPDPSGTVIPASGSASFTYTCTYAQAPSNPKGTNTATASWDGKAFFTPDGSANGTASADFGSVTPTTTNKTITVTDSQAGTLGTVTGTDSSPFASKTFSYSKTFSAPASGCVTINNIATITQTGQTASASVQNCGTLGALTMGFWQNKNGQAIIGNATLGGPLANYLTGFAPFKDYPQKSGQTVAQYFTAVFNAANASGSGAPMLKAQMLATALDVYFWKQIGAPADIGNVTVDVSAYAAAFGNPAGGKMTVNQMLSYASSQWNGGNPYGGNKTLTTLAISAFNAVNNSTISEV